MEYREGRAGAQTATNVVNFLDNDFQRVYTKWLKHSWAHSSAG